MSIGGSNRRFLVLMGLAMVPFLLVFIYPLVLDIPLLDPDEGIFASIARGMMESGDWITPRFQGEPFFSKPILYFWAEALSLRVFGVHEASLRLPGLLFGLMGAVTTAALAWRLFDRKTGVLAGLFYGTTILPAGLAQSAAHDVSLIPWINLAILALWESERASSRRSSVALTLAAGLSLGLGCLAKGLLGLAGPGIAFGSYVLVTRRLSIGVCLRGALALVSGVLVAAPWYIAMAMRNPGYVHYYFVERHLMGYTTNSQPHSGRPIWYYLPIVLIGGLPWILYLPATLVDTWLRRKETRAGGSTDSDKSRGAVTLLLCWAIGCTVFLSLSHTKLITYIWPVFPPLAIISAAGWRQYLEGSLGPAARRIFERLFYASTCIGALLLPAGIGAACSIIGLHVSWRAWVAVVIAAAVTVLPLLVWRAGLATRALSLSIFSVAIQFAVVMSVVVFDIAPQYSAKELAAHFNASGKVPPHVYFVGERVGSIVFYLDRNLREGLCQGQFEPVDPKQQLDRLLDASPGAVAVVPEVAVKKVSGSIDLVGIDYRQVGRFRIYDVDRLSPAVLTALARNDRPITETASRAVRESPSVGVR